LVIPPTLIFLIDIFIMSKYLRFDRKNSLFFAIFKIKRNKSLRFPQIPLFTTSGISINLQLT